MLLKPRKKEVKREPIPYQSRSGIFARKKAEAARAIAYEAEAIPNNELHSFFFGVPNTPVRLIREKLDPVLTVREIREIYLDSNDD
jgi:hypothetical protein